MTYNHFVMKIFLFISLITALKVSIASLEIADYSDDQICLIAKDPPLSEQVTFEINARKIICNEGIAIRSQKYQKIKPLLEVLNLKDGIKCLEEKGQFIQLAQAPTLKIDTFGDEKSITIDRAF